MFQDQGKNITEFIAGCDEACLTVLNSLSSDFAVHHRPNEPSDTGLSLVRAPSSSKLSDVRNNTHTDTGTLTLLFYNEWSLQAFLPDAKIWAFTPILDGCVLANIANSLERLSGWRLHSPRHRVTQPFDGAKERLFISYFLRPEEALKKKWEAGV
jgi:isopenicillin N synthase-like dioxygenase